MKKRVLIVDDEAPIRELISRILEREDFEFSFAANGNEGLHMIDEVAPELIITDISMPDMEGVEFISRIRKGGNRAPIIAMSGNPVGMSFLKASKMFGAAETLLKPFSRMELLEAVERLMPPQ